MLETIEQAARNFCIHQIRESFTLQDGVVKTRTLIAYIDIDAKNKKKYRVYIALDKGFIQRVSKIFFEEDENDEDALIDMALETTNLIVGSAKVVSEEQNENPYTISTPRFEKFDLFDFAYDEAKTLNIQNDTISIAIKEINA